MCHMGMRSNRLDDGVESIWMIATIDKDGNVTEMSGMVEKSSSFHINFHRKTPIMITPIEHFTTTMSCELPPFSNVFV